MAIGSQLSLKVLRAGSGLWYTIQHNEINTRSKMSDVIKIVHRTSENGPALPWCSHVSRHPLLAAHGLRGKGGGRGVKALGKLAGRHFQGKASVFLVEMARSEITELCGDLR